MAMSSSPSATVAVEKATSDLLISPDWTMNIDICDSVNSLHWQAKDVVKAVKKRLLHKSPKVQLLALTLLETMVKNCGDYVHLQIIEKNILGEMVKIVKKKTDMHVRDKILVLLDSWQEAFGGPGGKHPQYYWAYEELRRSGVQFPPHSLDTVPIFTPPVAHPPLQPAQAGYGMPSNSTRRLDETMATEIEGLSLSILDSMGNIMELLSDMMQAVNPGDREAVKDEVIVDLVNRCRSNQKKLMQMLTTTGDEELLAHGLELNDNLQTVLARHDAIATGSPMPTQAITLNPKPTDGISNSKPAEGGESSPTPYTSTTAPVANVTRAQLDEEDEEEDDFAMLARRHSKTQPSPSQSTYGSNGSLVLAEPSQTTSTMNNLPNAAPCKALALPDPPAPLRITKEQDMIDFLSITLSATPTSDNPSNHSTPPGSSRNIPQMPVSSATQGYSSSSHGFSGNQGQGSYNSYIVPWAQPHPQQQLQPSSQPQQQFHTLSLPQSQPQPQPQQQLHHQSQPELQAQLQLQMQSQYPQYTSGFPPPPWAATLGYPSSQNHIGAINNTFSAPQASRTASYTPMQVTRPLQHHNSLPARGSNGSAINSDSWISSGSRNAVPSGGQKPFVPSYRLFEDLNVLGSADGRFKTTSGTSQSLSGASGQGMVGGRK